MKDHVLLPRATELEAVDRDFRARLTPERLRAIVANVPDAWLTDRNFESVEAQRAMYVEFLVARLAASSIFIQQANHARHPHF